MYLKQYFVFLAVAVLLPQVVTAATIENLPRMDKTELGGIFDPGGWGVLPGYSESVFVPNANDYLPDQTGDVGEGVFSPGGFGVFSPGGFGFLPGGWELDGVDVEDFSGDAPGRLSLWWRSLTETVSLAFTLDPVQKNMLRLEYAEERMQIAESFARHVEGPNDIKQIEASVRRAHSMMNAIGRDADKWLQAGDENSQQLLGNLLRHQLNREKIMDKIEGRLHDNNLVEIREMRQQGLQISQQVLGKTEQQDMPDDVRAHVRSLKSQFAVYENNVKTFNVERQLMIEKKVKGDGEAALQLNKMEKERRALMHSREVMQLRVQRLPKGQKPQNLQPGIELREWKAQQVGGAGQAEEPPMETISGSGQAEEPPMETISGAGGQAEEPPMETMNTGNQIQQQGPR